MLAWGVWEEREGQGTRDNNIVAFQRVTKVGTQSRVCSSRAVLCSKLKVSCFVVHALVSLLEPARCPHAFKSAWGVVLTLGTGFFKCLESTSKHKNAF